MVHARTAIARLAAIAQRRFRVDQLSGPRVTVIVGHRRGRCAVAGSHGLASCLRRGHGGHVARGVSQMIHMHGRPSNARTVGQPGNDRSEEHTSELQSLMRTSYAVFRLDKQKNIPTYTTI